ncbi:MAG: TetR family transcriptional regulator [Balneolales bacterium]
MNSEIDLEKKQRIIKAALDIYTENPSSFTLKSIAKKARVKEAEIYSFFPNKTAILKSFYTGIVPAYNEMIREIEGYEKYDLSEKLSNFVYSSLDMMQEQRDFVEKTFDELIVRAQPKSRFQIQVESLIEEFVKNDLRISATHQYLLNSIAFKVLSREYLYLIQYWINDESLGSEKTIALTDKYTAFLSEILYSAVIDKGIDLGRFLISNRVLMPKPPLWESCMELFFDKGMSK